MLDLSMGGCQAAVSEPPAIFFFIFLDGCLRGEFGGEGVEMVDMPRLKPTESRERRVRLTTSQSMVWLVVTSRPSSISILQPTTRGNSTKLAEFRGFSKVIWRIF